MSKGGGAGKVYFVLYLAVVLELLIIIVERDEAEESLLKKQRETMKIVESILSQLQSGAGTEGINTRPQDEITIPPPGINLKEVLGADVKSSRKYIVEVGVTDISTSLKRREGETDKEHSKRVEKLIELGNVEELEYQIFYNSSTEANNAPLFPSDVDILKQKLDFTKFQPGQTIQGPDASNWEFLSIRKLMLDKVGTFNKVNLAQPRVEDIHPIYPRQNIITVGPSYSPPNMPEDSIFYYSEIESNPKTKGTSPNEMQKRSFVVNFQPVNKAGWYKLRFASRTNRILGVRGDANLEELSDETTINIGTVQLTVKDLRKVNKELLAKLEKFRLPSFEVLLKDKDIDAFDAGLKSAIDAASGIENANEVIGNIKLYGYIAKLLAPGQSSNFSQNRGAIEFNVRVITPHPAVSNPTAGVPKYVATFDKVPAVFEFTISPYQGETNNVVEGRVLDLNGQNVSRINCQPLDKIAGSGVTPPASGGARQYRGLVENTLSPGKYSIEITHKLSGKAQVEKGDMEVFKTGLTEESASMIKSRLNSYAFYGYPISNIDAQPTSGGKIPSRQFKTYIHTDVDIQRPAIDGLSITKDNAINLDAKANKVSIRVSWIQPYTNQEVDLFPEQSFPINQEEPEIITTNARPDVQGTATKIKIRVSNIRVGDLPTGSDKTAEITIKPGKPEVADGLKTYGFSIEPSIDGDAKNGYNVYLEMTGNLPRGEDKVKGTIRIPLTATAINPVNGKESEQSSADVFVNISYEPDRGLKKKTR